VDNKETCLENRENKIEAITDIPFELDMEDLLEKIHVETGSSDAEEFEALVQKVRKRGRPKVVYKESFIQSKDEKTVTIDNVTFTSRTLRMNLEKVERVFPYVATCGREVDEIRFPEGELLKAFWLDTIKETLLDFGCQYLDGHLNHKYMLAKISSMSPGSGDTIIWPIEQQKELFSLFGNVEDLIGVSLTDSCLMIPIKSVSGIRFPTEIDFRSCQVCHREKCPSRSAPFDKELWESIQLDKELEA